MQSRRLYLVMFVPVEMEIMGWLFCKERSGEPRKWRSLLIHHVLNVSPSLITPMLASGELLESMV